LWGKLEDSAELRREVEGAADVVVAAGTDGGDGREGSVGLVVVACRVYGQEAGTFCVQAGGEEGRV
jgi:hypothetical protein